MVCVYCYVFCLPLMVVVGRIALLVFCWVGTFGEIGFGSHSSYCAVRLCDCTLGYCIGVSFVGLIHGCTYFVCFALHLGCLLMFSMLFES